MLLKGDPAREGFELRKGDLARGFEALEGFEGLKASSWGRAIWQGGVLRR